ncbi:MAG: low specificity L-threonine aldolase [Ruminococcaceae bacterium]|nr:low specificity L-threonine aldolase [Oscillospiraceae bacterium]
MLNFESDYTRGAHPKVLERLIETNMEQTSGYGSDEYCNRAKERIRNACASPNADVWFFTGGTQTNQTVISSLLRSYEGVIAAESGHIATHEAGAIEYTGHKVLSLPHTHGKLSACVLKPYLMRFFSDENHDHAVFPGMVYISHPTEYGTLYTLSELAELSAVCREYHLPLYMDGARLGYGLMSDGTDVTLSDIAKLCDVFYIGGTKVGALCGEAVVFPKGNSPKQFMTMIKQHGALLAKGRLLGIQFDALFENGLYFTVSRQAIERANELREALKKKGYSFFLETPANQIFIVLENTKLKQLESHARFSFWEQADETHTVVRIATDWATTQEEVNALLALL